MQISSRFTVAVHILMLLKRENQTSELIADSVNTNPVVIRRIEAMLKNAGLIEIFRGKKGAMITCDPSQTTLFDVYKAVESLEDVSLFRIHDEPNPKCEVGANIHAAVIGTLAEAQSALENVLRSVTLDQVDQRLLNEISRSL